MKVLWLWGDVWVQSCGSLLGSLTGLQLSLLVAQQQGKRENEHMWSEAVQLGHFRIRGIWPFQSPVLLIFLCGKSQTTEVQRALRC